MKFNPLTVALLVSLTSAHFTVDSPPARGFNEEELAAFPCGGSNSIASTRTPFPLNGGRISMTMGHDRTLVQVLVALGNDPTTAFNTVLVPTTQVEGLGKFCLSDVNIPESLGAREGENATIQVVTNGDPTGGLYNCADITFSSTSTANSECTSGKGVQQTRYTGQFSNANGTDSTTPTTSGSSPATGTPAATNVASTSLPSSATGKLGVGAAAVLGVCLLECLAQW